VPVNVVNSLNEELKYVHVKRTCREQFNQMHFLAPSATYVGDCKNPIHLVT